MYPSMKKVTLKIYNVLGQEIEIILDNKEQEVGYKEYIF